MLKLYRVWPIDAMIMHARMHKSSSTSCNAQSWHHPVCSDMPALPDCMPNKVHNQHSRCITHFKPQISKEAPSLLARTGVSNQAKQNIYWLASMGTHAAELCLLVQVIQRVLAGLEGRYNTERGRPVLGVVQLTGLAHTEDVVAFKEIARQLCKYVAPGWSAGPA